MKSQIVIEANQKNRCDSTRTHRYVSAKDIRAKHPEEAEAFIEEKKRLQRVHGDRAPNLPHWFANPDFPQNAALYLEFDRFCCVCTTSKAPKSRSAI